jgi:hypothetical protein
MVVARCERILSRDNLPSVSVWFCIRGRHQALCASRRSQREIWFQGGPAGAGLLGVRDKLSDVLLVAGLDQLNDTLIFG